MLQINCSLIIRMLDCYCFQASLWVIICLRITSRWQVASILQAHSSRRGGPVFVLAKSAAQAWLSPLLDTVCERLVFILRNLYKLAAERILSEECSRGKSLIKMHTIITYFQRVVYYITVTFELDSVHGVTLLSYNISIILM